MKPSVFVFDPTVSDTQSRVRGVGRYLQILKENFPEWTFINDLSNFQTFKHSNSVFINPFLNFLQSPLMMRRIAQKQIAIIHDLIPLKYPQHFPIGIRGKVNVFLNRLALKNYDRVITDSEAGKKDIKNILGIEDNKITVIYPCLPKVFQINQKRSEVGKIRNRNNSDKSENSDVSGLSDVSGIRLPISSDSSGLSGFCLYVGDATWNKNLVNLAKAIKIINVSCVFVGKVFERAIDGTRGEENFRVSQLSEPASPTNFLGESGERSRRYVGRRVDLTKKFSSPDLHPWQKEFHEFLNEIKDDKRFILKGFVPDQELIQLYQSARVNILPSRDEGFGFSYLEAASQKCPSVLADINVLHEISDNNAVFADSNNPHDIANAIGELYWNNEKRTIIGIKTFERCGFFSSNQFKKSFLKIIKE